MNEEAIAAEVELLKRAQDSRLYVLHVETGTLGQVHAVYEGGWIRHDITTTEPLAQFSATRPDGSENTFSRFEATMAQLHTGDAFWVKPGAFVELDNLTGSLHTTATKHLADLLAGLAILGKREKIPMPTVLAIAVSTLRVQLRHLTSLQEKQGAARVPDAAQPATPPVVIAPDGT